MNLVHSFSKQVFSKNTTFLITQIILRPAFTMHFNIALLTLSLSTLTYAIPIPNSLFALRPREVPQEHSHNAVLASVQTSLQLNNPAGIKDSVFGLLGNKAAAAGQGSISNTDCLKQATADQAFTNAKAAKDVKGMTNALIYQALERNTAKVGQASVACTAIKAKNPEIAAVGVHQVYLPPSRSLSMLST